MKPESTEPAAAWWWCCAADYPNHEPTCKNFTTEPVAVPALCVKCGHDDSTFHKGYCLKASRPDRLTCGCRCVFPAPEPDIANTHVALDGNRYNNAPEPAAPVELPRPAVFIPLAIPRVSGGWQGALASGERFIWKCDHYHVNASKNIGNLPPMMAAAEYYQRHPEKRSARSCAVIEASRRLNDSDSL